jgi:glutaredoxin
MKIQLLFLPGCPNLDATRAALASALAATDMHASIEEVDVTGPGTPEEFRRWGSPTVLVEGQDVAGEEQSNDSACRLYPSAGGLSRVPSAALLMAALRRAMPHQPSGMGALAAVPGGLLSLLPAAHCPACLGAYGALLSSLGVGFLLKQRVLAPLIALALVAGVVTVAWSGRTHGRRGPLLLTIAGSAAIACARLLWNVPPLVYGGGLVLVAASLWNLWLKAAPTGAAREPSPPAKGRSNMATKRTIEVFSAGCPCCDEAVRIVQGIASTKDHLRIYDMHSDPAAQAMAAQYGIKRVPAVVVDGRLADCCEVGAGVDLATLRSLGIGQP